MDKDIYLQLGNINSKTTIVYLHGAKMDKTIMTTLMCNKKYNHIFIDLPSHGDSNEVAMTSISEMADYISILLTSLIRHKVCSKKVYLVGYSMGGCVALDLANRGKGFIKKLVILSAGADIKGNCQLLQNVEDKKLVDFNTLDLDENSTIDKLLEKALGITSTNGVLDFDNLFKNCFGSRSSNTDRKNVYEAILNANCDDITLYTDILAINNFKLDNVSNIKLPVLIIGCGEDILIPFRLAEKLHKELKKSKLVALSGRGHTGVFEEKEYVRKLIGDFIK